MTGGSNNSEFRSRSNSHKSGAGAGPAEGDKKLHPPQKKLLTIFPTCAILQSERGKGITKMSNKIYYLPFGYKSTSSENWKCTEDIEEAMRSTSFLIMTESEFNNFKKSEV